MTYEDLEQALKEGHEVQRCTITPEGAAAGWWRVKAIDRDFDTSRYRIVKKDGTIIDGLEPEVA